MMVLLVLGAVDGASGQAVGQATVGMQVCTELAGPNLEVAGSQKVEGRFIGQGQAGVDAFGNGFAGKVTLNTTSKFPEVSVKGAWSVLKVTICVTSPSATVKELLDKGKAGTKATATSTGKASTRAWDGVFGDLAQLQAKFVQDGPAVIGALGLSGAKLAALLDQIDELDLEPDPAEILSDASQLLSRLADAFPLTDRLRARLMNAGSLIEKIGGRLRNVCDNLPASLPSDIFADICSSVGDGEALRAALEDTRKIVDNVQGTVGDIKKVVNSIDDQVFDNQRDHDCGFFRINCPSN
jgi:hypothetical protein